MSQADRAQWQQQASAELAAILAAHPDLPAISWTTTPGGASQGRYSCRVTRGSRELFTAWRQGLGLQEFQETTLGDGTSYVRVHASRGTIRVTLTAVVANMDARDNLGRRGPRPVQAADANRPAVDVAPAPPWARPAPPPDLAGPSLA